jgi:hypothetical protein
MAVLGATAHAESNHTSYGTVALICFELAAVAFGVLCALSLRSKRLTNRRGVLLGIAAGVWFGVSDISIKAVTSGHHGVWSVLGPWSWVGIGCAFGAFFASARSFQIGEGIGVIAASTAAANLLGIIAGILVFGDPLGNDPFTVAGRLTAFALVVIALALVPAPVRAENAAREQEQVKSSSDAQERRQRGRSGAAAATRQPAAEACTHASV